MPKEQEQQKWFPLESNPQLMNEYIHELGFDISRYEFVDVFSYEDWALSMIPQPVQAVVMLYPLTSKQLEHIDSPDVIDHTNKNVWYMKQRIGNACGTIGLLHSIMNLVRNDPTLVQPNSWLEKFVRDTTGNTMDPIQRAERLESDQEISKLHDKATSSSNNQTIRGELDDDIITHFIAFVKQKQQQQQDTKPTENETQNNDSNSTYILYELDGNKAGPVQHGLTSSTTFLHDACQMIQQFMQRDPTEIRFTILALAPTTTAED